MNKYILVEWPESQQFMEDDRCLPCIEIDGAIFVPEDLYRKVTGFIHEFKEYYGG